MAVRTVAITRSKDDAKEFIELAKDSSIRPLPVPTIELVSRGPHIVQDFLDSIQKHRPDYSVFMSSKAVKILFDTARQSSSLEKLQIAVANTTVLAVGPKTRDALESENMWVNHMPEKTFSSVGIGEVFTRINAAGKMAIIPRSGASTPFLKELLNKIGLRVLEIHMYDVRAFSDASQWEEFSGLFLQGGIDGMVFTSASSVRGFFDIMAKNHGRQHVADALSGMRIVAIGPFTADELVKFDIKNTISQVHTVKGSFDTMNQLLS